MICITEISSYGKTKSTLSTQKSLYSSFNLISFFSLLSDSDLTPGGKGIVWSSSLDTHSRKPTFLRILIVGKLL